MRGAAIRPSANTSRVIRLPLAGSPRLTAGLVALMLVVIFPMTGCNPSLTTTSAPRSGAVSLSEADVGDTLPLGAGVAVTLVSAESSVPPGVSADPMPGEMWLVLEVANSTDETITVPSRPYRPMVLDPNGARLRVRMLSASLRGGGGGWGPAAGSLGEPYLSPGGVMRVAVAVEDASPEKAGRPLTVRYAPFLRHGAEFVVR